MIRRTGPRWPLLLLPALVLAISCGVPISAEEITATAESERAAPQLAIVGDAAMSREAVALQGRLTPSAVSAIAGLTTSTPGVSATPNPSGTPTPEASGTPNATTTTTPDASTTPSGTPGTETPTATATIQPTAQAPSTDFVAQVVVLVNEYRVANKLTPLTANPYITTAAGNYAQLYATQMAQSSGFSHTGPDGSTSASRMAAAGYPGCFWGENVAAGQTTPAAAVKTWKESPAHNAILLSPDAIEIGVGYSYNANSYYKHYWVLMTGRPSCVME